MSEVSLNLSVLRKWTKYDHLSICVGVDVGGSGIRVRISNALEIKSEYIDLKHIKVKTTAKAIEALTNIEKSLENLAPDFECKGATIAVAGPIKNGICIITNWEGTKEQRTIHSSCLPSRIFPKDRTFLINDLEAGAYGVIAADKQGILESKFELLFGEAKPGESIINNSRTAVLAMGTGLGGAIIVKSQFLDKPFVFPTEIGHLQIPIVCSGLSHKEEEEMLENLSSSFYDGKLTPEFEDLCSGKGLCYAYKYLLEKEKGSTSEAELDPPKIAEKAQKGDKIARDALLWHYRMFTRAAKIIATSLSCGSILMALDNQVKNSWFISQVAEELATEFNSFTRPDWIKNVKCYTQKEILNFNILGADYMAHQIANK
ncbi:Glucokinase 1 [Histomonas meleagridis]|uniref:Glucokinase 1 n=1 Tax=Histomonas meleagridis TaxID=135588 RepID=UPI00355AC209|nr:Glucokinase 1 [Histomonas meleagridis]KAH0801469.1 Glucokinase 1 [Histomonas meleagridis]